MDLVAEVLGFGEGFPQELRDALSQAELGGELSIVLELAERSEALTEQLRARAHLKERAARSAGTS